VYVRNEIFLVTLLKSIVSYTKPEDGKGKGKNKGKVNLFSCSTKHQFSKVYCEMGGMDPRTLNLDS
jgi:hypothetical protein